MVPQRITVKFFAKPGSKFEPNKFIAMFHKFIQNNAVEGLLVDVADYGHVPNGPGILLIGHDVDYAMDLTGGKPGLLVRRKRYKAPLREILRDTLRKALLAARAIQDDGSTAVTYAFDCVEIALVDRLVAHNTDHAFAQFRGDIQAVLEELYGSGNVSIEHGDPDLRKNLSALVAARNVPTLDQLIDRLGVEAAV